MTDPGNGNDRTLSKGPSEGRRDPGGGGASGENGMRDLDPDERLAAALDEDLPQRMRAEIDELTAREPRAARTVAQMREVREALRREGRALAPDGFEAAVMARLSDARRKAAAIRIQGRRDRVLVILQAASLAALLFAYAAIFGATRIYDVGPRWSDSTRTSAAAPQTASTAH